MQLGHNILGGEEAPPFPAPWAPFFFFFNIYLFLRERDKESQAGSRLRAISTEPDVRLEPTNHKIMT